jgi:Type I restriction enzyme R protein N terminus (HSDR_N)
MDFPTYNFNLLGETDIREEIVAPLLRHLGYRSGTTDNVIREQQLSYPQLQLGKRKPTDPPLRGIADYICEAGGLIKWVIEAKPPGEDLNKLVQEQAWSYANHPQIRAVYFVVTNGLEFKIYQTNKGADAPALFECSYQQMADKMTVIENILFPSSILRDHPTLTVDTNIPLGPGLRSITRITSGQIKFTNISIPVPPLEQMIMTITSGSVERKVDGLLEAHLSSLVPFDSLQKLNEKLGLDQMRLTSTSSAISADPERPTTFENERRIVIPKGTVALNLSTWTEVEMPTNVTANVKTRAVGYLVDSRFVGRFFAEMNYPELGLNLTLEGEFKLQLA